MWGPLAPGEGPGEQNREPPGGEGGRGPVGGVEGSVVMPRRRHTRGAGLGTRRVTFGRGVEALQASYSEGADGTLVVTLPPLEEAGCPSACVPSAPGRGVTRERAIVDPTSGCPPRTIPQGGVYGSNKPASPERI